MPLLGQHTIAETADLVKAKDYEIQKLNDAWTKWSGDTMDTERAVDATWMDDWFALKQRYEAAKILYAAEVAAVTASAPPFVSLNLLTVETSYQKILSALQAVPGLVSKGDLQDLWNRFTSVSGTTIAEDPSAVQPSASTTDGDLAAYKWSDNVIKAGEKVAANVAKNPYTWLIGGVAGLASLAYVKTIFRR